VPDPIPVRSPWIDELSAPGRPQPLDRDVTVDVAVVGAGIAGAATSFFILRDTALSVLLVERDRMGHGATGHNAGQLTTYFERPLIDLVDAYGLDQAIAAQRSIDGAWDLLELMVAESGAPVRIDRFIGHMGMFTLNHLCVHLGDSLLRRGANLRVPACIVADDAPFLPDIPREFSGLYSVVSRRSIHQLLGGGDDRYCAVLSDKKGCANGALLVEQIVGHLQERFADRFRFVDHTPVRRVALDARSVTIAAGEHRATASRVVMCTNGFMDHVVENLAGPEIERQMHHRVSGTVGYVAGFLDESGPDANALSFIRNAVIGESTPYVYVTRRPYARSNGPRTLTCIGGPETELTNLTDYSPESSVPADVIAEIDGEILPIVLPNRDRGLPYDYAWHGVMAYTDSKVRLIGFEPRNPTMMYNLGCNGVGMLPSIYGGYRIARLLRGDDLEPSIFDPPDG
jgi:glycine/D-amino acid oxidase-like deaminating enzyme